MREDQQINIEVSFNQRAVIPPAPLSELVATTVQKHCLASASSKHRQAICKSVRIWQGSHLAFSGQTHSSSCQESQIMKTQLGFSKLHWELPMIEGRAALPQTCSCCKNSQTWHSYRHLSLALMPVHSIHTNICFRAQRDTERLTGLCQQGSQCQFFMQKP